jgi:hypothetical protein
MLASMSVYEQIVDIATDYLGPAAQRFVDRQVANHLHKAPDKMTTRDIPTLINWSKIALGLLTDDQRIIDEFVTRVNRISTGIR